MMPVFVRLGSHHASAKLDRLLGMHPQQWFSLYHAQLADISEDRLTEALQIKGITRANVRDIERWHQCWTIRLAEKSHGKL